MNGVTIRHRHGLGSPMGWGELVQVGLLLFLLSLRIEQSSPGVKTKCIAIDFSQGFEVYDKIEAELEGLDIAILGK